MVWEFPPLSLCVNEDQVPWRLPVKYPSFWWLCDLLEYRTLIFILLLPDTVSSELKEAFSLHWEREGSLPSVPHSLHLFHFTSVMFFVNAFICSGLQPALLDFTCIKYCYQTSFYKLLFDYIPDRYFFWSIIHPNLFGLEPLLVHCGLTSCDCCLHYSR